jgi:hypothetical protein
MTWRFEPRFRLISRSSRLQRGDKDSHFQKGTHRILHQSQHVGIPTTGFCIADVRHDRLQQLLQHGFSSSKFAFPRNQRRRERDSSRGSVFSNTKILKIGRLPEWNVSNVNFKGREHHALTLVPVDSLPHSLLTKREPTNICNTPKLSYSKTDRTSIRLTPTLDANTCSE